MVRGEEALTEEEVVLSKEEIRAMAALYASECYFATNQLAVRPRVGNDA